MGVVNKATSIMVVEDDADVGETIKTYLDALGEPQVQLLLNGDDAYNFATKQIRERKKIDLIITDYRMGRTSGLDFIKKIRKNDFLKNCPIVLVSGHLQEEIIKEAASLKGVSFIVKPFDQKTLGDKVERILQAKRDAES